MIGPGVEGQLTIRDAQLRQIVTVDTHSADEVRLHLPAGDYVLANAQGQELARVHVNGGESTQYAPAGAVVAQAQASASATAAGADPAPPASPADAPVPRWRRISAPIMAATLPGLGHMVNRQAGKGVGILVSTFGLGVSAAVLYAAGTPQARALTGANAPSFAMDALRLGSVGVLTGALQLLYAGQIMDASRLVNKRAIRPRREFKLAFEVTRMATVGMNARDRQASLYTDWGLSMMGQPTDRLTVGVSDVSLKTNWGATRSTMQAGARVGYRFYDKDRLWLGGAAGALVQASFRDVAPSEYNPEAEWQTEQALTAAPYLQFETRWFLLDRWSLHLMPRVSMPFGTRYYSGSRSIASQALTFEIGSGVGVHF